MNMSGGKSGGQVSQETNLPQIRGPVSGINTRWAHHGSSIPRLLMNNGCGRFVSVHLRTLRDECLHVLLLQRSALDIMLAWLLAGHKKGSGREQPSDWKLALFVLGKCHNWKTIELSPECVRVAECSVGPGMRTSQHHSVLINKALGELP